MRLKQKSSKVISFSRLCLWLKLLYHFSVCCIVTPLPYLPTWYNGGCNFSGNFHIQRLGSFQHKAKDQIPLDLRKKEMEGVRMRSVSRVQPMTFRSCELVDVTDQGRYWIGLWEASLLHVALMSGEAGSAPRWRWGGTKKGGGRAIMFRSEGEDECSHRMQPLSLLNLTHRGEGKRQQRHGDRRMKTRGREMGFQRGREGGRHGQGDGIITGWRSKRYWTQHYRQESQTGVFNTLMPV